jgi:hypothetical protein
MDRLEPDFPYYSLLTIPIILLNISQNTPSVKHALPGWEAKYIYAETLKNGGMGVLRQRRTYSFA